MNELPVSRNRIQSIDILRGIVMVIMALDHVRDARFRNVGEIDHHARGPGIDERGRDERLLVLREQRPAPAVDVDVDGGRRS